MTWRDTIVFLLGCVAALAALVALVEWIDPPKHAPIIIDAKANKKPQEPCVFIPVMPGVGPRRVPPNIA